MTLRITEINNTVLLDDHPPPTFAHVADALFEHIVSVLVHMCAQEVLEAVVDLQSRGGHWNPLPDRVALHVLQVLNAFDHLFILPVHRDAISCPLRKNPLPLCGSFVILVFTVCPPQTGLDYSLMAFYLSGLWCDYLLMTETPTVKKPASDAAHTKALFSVASSHSRFCVCPSARREFTEVFVLIQTLHFITVQFWDGTVVSVIFTVEIRGATVYVFKLNIFSTSLSVRLPSKLFNFFL